MHRIDRSLVRLLSIAIVVGLLRLIAAPLLWWDEGWTLTVARNWVESGHYDLLACLLLLFAWLPAVEPKGHTQR
jgi:hypothetical protein